MALTGLNPWRGLNELPKTVWWITSATLINRAGSMAMPFLALYLTERRGFTESQAGLVLACYGAGALIVSPFAGRLADAWHPLHVMRASLFASGLITACIPLLHGMPLIMLSAVVWSAAAESFRPANLSILTSLVPPHQRRAAIALNRLAINLGFSIGPAVGGILAAFSYPLLFLVDAITSLLAGLHLTFAVQAPAMPHESRGEAEPAPAALDRRLLLWFLASVTLATLAFFQHASSLALYMVRYLGLKPSAYGFAISVNTVLIVFAEVPVNLRMARWPHSRAMATGTLLVGLGLGALVFARGFLSVALAIVVFTFGEMIFLPSAAVYASELAPPGQSGQVLGLYSMSVAVAFAIGPPLGAFSLQHFGPTALWTGTLAVALVSSAMMLRCRRA